MKRWPAWALAVAVVWPLAADAGQHCEQRPLTTQELMQGLTLAEATARALDATGADVVAIARAGQDLRRWGLEWSHMGLAYRVSPPNGVGQIGVWRVVHKLNQCGTAEAKLYRHGLGEFFMDQPWRYAAAYSVLRPELQQRLLPWLARADVLLDLAQPRYNVLSYPWSQRYQQSNQWVLEVLAANHGGQNSRQGAQSVLRAMNYEPGLLNIPAATRLGANLTRANVAFDDQPWSERMAGRIRTITSESVFQWLRQSGLGEPIRVVE
ncbi:membrane protein [Vitreoscilla filiformis]|jgi:hypothetical protein|uniref:Membrane protein n=1 Tax=Vitreoscilla filiformis TaxID=63 RepID=A0A221KCC3_VITFI|nr:DUF2145 domain-containing protein [Vitreoscilla filiformis]ASM76656.1 membrane protein [Vitreoscilla filiformis]